MNSYSPTGLQAQFAFLFGYEPQVAEIGGVTLTNYGPAVAPEDVPASGHTYQGRSGAEADWRDAAAVRIDQSRKADLNVDVRDAAGNPVAGAVVQVRLKEHAFGFGSTVAASGINDTHPVNGPNYRDVIERYFNKVVLENDLKWPNWQNNPATAIGALDWLESRGKDDIRGHNLIWPGWQFIPASPGSSYAGVPYRVDPAKPDSQEEYEAHVLVDGRADADAWLRQRVLDHIAEEAGHPQVRGRLRDWDVVNEPYTIRVVQELLSGTFGGDPRSYLTEWFNAARAADAGARLFLNDYPSLTGGADLDAFYATIQYLLDDGAPLDGIGFQGHLGANTPGMDALLATFERFAAFGKVMQITEFDQESRDLQLQADFLRDFLTLTFSHPSVDAFVMWGFWQGRQSRPAGALWRTDWSLKPNGQQWLDLTQAEWHTDVTGSTFADGRFHVRGFQGEYEVVVFAGGKTFVLTPRLGADGTTLTVVLPPPSVESVIISDGALQRSRIPALTAVFDGVVTLDARAFEVRDGSGQLVIFDFYAEERDGRTWVTLTFEGSSLPDGTYTLTILADGIYDGYGQALDGDGDGTAGGDHVAAFFRLFGDSDGDGDGDVDDDDLAAFRSTLNLSEGDAGYLAFFDADFDDDVDYVDFFQFRQRWSLR